MRDETSDVKAGGEQPFPGFIQALVLVAAYALLAAGSLVMIQAALGGTSEPPQPLNPAAMGLARLVAFTGVLALGVTFSRAPLPEVLPLARFHLGALLPLAAVATGLLILGSEADNLLHARFPMPMPLPSENDALVEHAPILLLTSAVVLPLGEELLCRGLLLRGFRGCYGVGPGIIMAAMIFGLLRGDLYHFPELLLLGIVLGWVKERTGSLLPCVFANACHRCVPLFCQWREVVIPGFSVPSVDGKVQFQPLWLNGLGLGCVVVGLGLLALILRRARSPDRAPA